MKHLIRNVWNRRREAATTLAYWSGLGSLYSAISKPKGAIVLMYHSIADSDTVDFVDPPNRLCPRLFNRQMEFLARHRVVISLTSLIEMILSGNSPVAGTVCITFDDGYLDNLAVAAPILAKYNLPATIYLATGYVDRGEEQWADRLYWMFNRRTADRLVVLADGHHEFDLARQKERRMARGILHKQLLEAAYVDRKQLLNAIELQLRPTGAMKRVTLTWEEVREICRRYPTIELGGHTCDHIDLRTHVGDHADLEIQNCMNEIHRETGIAPLHFSFPYGRYCSETKESVRASGWVSAVGSSNLVRVDIGSDRFVLPRVDAPRTMTGLRFKTSGAHPGLLQWAQQK
jgi:peptidoglycan/xylan/chitin deacetylase (PgdA/CDA1 family)